MDSRALAASSRIDSGSWRWRRNELGRPMRTGRKLIELPAKCRNIADVVFGPVTLEPLADDGRCYTNVRPPRFVGILAGGEGRLDAEGDAAQEVAQTDDLRREPTVRGRVVIVDVRERDARRGPAEPDERRRLARAADE